MSISSIGRKLSKGLLLLCLLMNISLLQAQDDMYGDETPTKSNSKSKTQTPASKSGAAPASGNSQTAPLPANTPHSVVYLMRPLQSFYGNNGVFQIKFSGIAVTELKAGSRVAFTMYSEGTLKVLCQYKTASSTEFYKTITIDIKKGGNYYVMLSYLFDQTKLLDAENGARLWKDESQYKTAAENLYESPQAPLTTKPVEPPPAPAPAAPAPAVTTPTQNIPAGHPYYTNGLLVGGGYIAVPLSTVEKATKLIVITDDGIRLNAKLVTSDKPNNLAMIKITDSLYRDPGCNIYTERIPAVGDTMTCYYKDYKDGLPNIIKMKVLIKQAVVPGGSPFIYSLNASLPSVVHSGVFVDRWGRLSGLGMPDNAGTVQSSLKFQYVKTYAELLGAPAVTCANAQKADPLGNNLARIILVEVNK